ncbi:DUF4123 domain-containing protein [Luteibacter sp.]|uniref:DUF4123 domain-containing protein n=1 Tax=Luteibacter sp. TaxID=1886636 RepID=UPI002F40987F
MKAMDWPAWRRWLADTMGEARGRHGFLLVDGRAFVEAPEVMAALPEAGGISLWQGSLLESLKHIAPFLLPYDRLRPSDDDALEVKVARRLWADEDRRYALTWLCSHAPLHVIAAHLQRHTKVTREDGKQFYQHFYDNRILHGLRSVWTAEQAQAFLGQVGYLCYERRPGLVERWEPAPSSDGKAASTEGLPQITFAQQEALAMACSAGKMALRLRTAAPGALGSMSDAQLHARVDALFDEAMADGIHTPSEIYAFVRGVVLGRSA